MVGLLVGTSAVAEVKAIQSVLAQASSWATRNQLDIVGCAYKCGSFLLIQIRRKTIIESYVQTSRLPTTGSTERG